MRANRYSKFDQLMQIVEDRGYRSTGPRQALVRTVAARDRHFTAEELRKDLPHVGRAHGLPMLEYPGRSWNLVSGLVRRW